MLPFVSLSCSAQPPPLIVPLSVSPPMLPVDVTGRSEETLPNEVCAVRLYPSPCGICTRMDENEVFNRMSRQPLVGRLAVTAIPPFWLSTLIFPPIPSSVPPAKDVLTFASPFTFRAVTELKRERRRKREDIFRGRYTRRDRREDQNAAKARFRISVSANIRECD